MYSYQNTYIGEFSKPRVANSLGFLILKLGKSLVPGNTVSRDLTTFQPDLRIHVYEQKTLKLQLNILYCNTYILMNSLILN